MRAHRGVPMAVAASLLVLALLAGCSDGSGGSDGSDGADATPSDETAESTDAAESTPEASDTEAEADAFEPSEAFCAAAAPLFEQPALAVVDAEVSKGRAAELIATYDAMAAEVDGDAAATLTSESEALASVAEDGLGDDGQPTSVSVPTEIESLVVPCAETAFTISPTAEAIGEVPAEIPSGTVAIEIQGASGLMVAMASKDADVSLDLAIAGATNEGVFVGSGIHLLTLEPGSYVVLAAPADAQEPSVDQAAEITVT